MTQAKSEQVMVGLFVLTAAALLVALAEPPPPFVSAHPMKKDFAPNAHTSILATPAPRLVGLVEPVAPRTAVAARRIVSASSVVVALAVPGGIGFPENSGVLVASGERLRAKAITLSSRKWGRHGDVELLRLSFGRLGDDVAARASDDERRIGAGRFRRVGARVPGQEARPGAELYRRRQNESEPAGQHHLDPEQARRHRE